MPAHDRGTSHGRSPGIRLTLAFRDLVAGLRRGRTASIALLGAAVIGMLGGMAAVAVDLGAAYLAKVSNQRVADAAAYAGALAYNSSGSAIAMSAAAGNLATLNGLPAGAIAATLVASPSGDGNSAVMVIASTASPLYLALIFQSNPTLLVSATAYAEVKPNPSACIISLLPKSTGVTLSGAAALTAANCSVASNTTVTVPCGTSITTKAVDYNSVGAPSQPCGGIQPPAGTGAVNIVKVATVDPLASNADVAAAFTHLTAVASLTGPSGPGAPTVTVGSDLAFGYTNSASQPPRSVLTAAGCSGSFAGSTWTVTCPSGGTYHFGNISLSGGITLSFATGGSATNTYDFSGTINVNGAGASFGPGTYNVMGGITTGGGTAVSFGNGNYNIGGAINVGGSSASFGTGTYNVTGGIVTGGGSTTTFGAGTYQIGKGTVSCSGSFYSVCNTGASLVFGAGGFTIAGGICNCSSGTLSLGAGSAANSFNIGAGSAGYALSVTGTVTLGDMTSGTFQSVGNISTAGGSTLTLSAASAHDLNGAFSLAGSATLGAGTWTIAGNVAFGGGGGGGSVTGTALSIITSGSFSVAAGYANVTLTAPASGPLQGLLVASKNAGGASFSEGASGNSLAGTLYFPIAPITLSGAGRVGGGGQCLELIGSAVTLSGGSAAASSCSGLAGGAPNGTVALVQ
jgi:hypothetical protein